MGSPKSPRLFFSDLQDDSQKTILQRAQRNLDRILEMQYEIEDILREKDYKTYYMLSNLLVACTDELEVLVTEHLGEKDIIQRIRQKIEDLYTERQPLYSRYAGFTVFTDELTPDQVVGEIIEIIANPK